MSRNDLQRIQILSYLRKQIYVFERKKTNKAIFSMFVKPDDDYDRLRHCGEKKGGGE